MAKRVAAVSLLLWATVVVSSAAQPVRREVLKDLRIEQAGECQFVTVELQLPFALNGFAPEDAGSLLVIRITPLPEGGAAAPSLRDREVLPAPLDVETALRTVEWEGDSVEGPLLTFLFAEPVAWEVTGGRDFRSITVMVQPESPAPARCQRPPEPVPGDLTQ